MTIVTQFNLCDDLKQITSYLRNTETKLISQLLTIGTQQLYGNGDRDNFSPRTNPLGPGKKHWAFVSISIFFSYFHVHVCMFSFYRAINSNLYIADVI